MINQDRLKELVNYSPETGMFTCLKNRKGSRNKIGATLGSLSKNGYIEFALDGKNYRAHRLAFLYMEGCFPPADVDHKNRNRSDNRWTNLRAVSHAQNMENDINPRSHGSLGYRGVYKKGNRFAAKIVSKAKQIHLGVFNTIEEAANAYLAAKPIYHTLYEG